MNIIKLSAINSTNDYLKELTTGSYTENFTVVVAEHQTAGRGQMGSRWEAAAGKNLTFSLLVKDLLLTIHDIFSLNVAVAVSIAEALESFKIQGISIKWPNDILAGNKKLGGILIENSIKPGGEISSIIGIGLNINQVDFEALLKATSLAAVTGQVWDKEEIMVAIVTHIKRNTALLMDGGSALLWKAYHQRLYKIDVPMPFEKEGSRFMGIIKGVNPTGTLSVLLENDTIAEYHIKEVQLLY